MTSACSHSQFTAECTECMAAGAPLVRPWPPVPVVPAIGRIMARGCVHRDGPGECSRCDELRAGEHALRSLAELRTLAARLDVRDHYGVEAKYARGRAEGHEQRIATTGGLDREHHERCAAVWRGIERVAELIVGLHHAPTVPPSATEGQAP